MTPFAYSITLFVVVVASFATQHAAGQQFAPARPFGRPSGRLPDYPELCRILRDRSLTRQYVDCALDKPGACNIVSDVNNIRDYLKAALPAALGRGTCPQCDPQERVKIAFVAKEFRQRYKPETSQLLNYYRDQIAANGGLRAQTPQDLIGAPAGC